MQARKGHVFRVWMATKYALCNKRTHAGEKRTRFQGLDGHQICPVQQEDACRRDEGACRRENDTCGRESSDVGFIAYVAEIRDAVLHVTSSLLSLSDTQGPF